MNAHPVSIDGAIITPSITQLISQLQRSDCEEIAIHRASIVEMLKFVTLDAHCGPSGEDSNVLNMTRSLVILLDIIETFNPDYQKAGTS